MHDGSRSTHAALGGNLPRPTLTRRTSASGGFDTLILGAGFAGSVLAERLASQLNQRVLVVDKRSHIGGNAYDRYDDAGVLIHPYGHTSFIPTRPRFTPTCRSSRAGAPISIACWRVSTDSLFPFPSISTQ